ncbi:protein ATS1 [Sporothrix schenckii 1099-18]|uniref:Protein ATS1 n=1 Tax=Sporothrix schenckii 1099-18 TaxID=1397361 RepID=A0A0F2MJM2_SPOSC|nr:protein ATS1 [Sporothrix schenckii 1099-18]KJR88386.1 protein ATS1 [Sporothrix schenckii 1099-18]
MVTVFALGSNGSGQLGIGHSEDVSIPRNILWADEPSPNSVSRIAAGGNHSLLLSGDGVLHWSGDATCGACGVLSGDKPAEPSFTKMNVDGPVQLIAATWEASIFTVLDSNGENTKVFTCGLGEKGELGQGPLVVRDPKASQLKNFPPPGTEIVDLAACMSHVVVVLSNGEVYGWGNGRKGQLGSPATIVFEPRKIEGIDFAVKRAVCGKDFTCFVGESGSGKISVIGQDKWEIKSKAPSEAPAWVDIGAGWGNICILKSDGKILAWGRDDYSQSTPPNDQKASKIAVGSEHVLALLETGDVLAWGWGEHGNCGPLVKQEGSNTKGQRRVVASSKFLPPGTRISDVGAGCATSWIIIENNSESGA